MHPRALTPGRKFLLKHTTHTTQTVVTELVSRLDLASYEPQLAPTEFGLNDLGEVRLRTARPLFYDGYAENRLTGSFILIEPGTHATVAAGMFHPPTTPARPELTDYTI